MTQDTIIARATPAGKGGVAVIRISGNKSLEFAEKLFKKEKNYFIPREAKFVNCYSGNEEIIDEGLVIFFKGPNSFTGEDVVEFQCHGSPVIVDMVLDEAVSLGARLANPGEFSERAFLNDKIDLAQAEAIADLIDSKSRQAAKNAVESLKGKFSEQINNIVDKLIELRCFLEASIDFPDEEGVEFINNEKVDEKLGLIIKEVQQLLSGAKHGVVFQEGLKVVLAGEPNVGKSSLLNLLARQDRAIVTDIAGTTRDVLTELISIRGVPVKIIDTAGLRESADIVEQEGIRRARSEIEKADLVLYLFDSSAELRETGFSEQKAWELLEKALAETSLEQRLVLVQNKIDNQGLAPASGSVSHKGENIPLVAMSAKSGAGLELLERAVLEKAGLEDMEESGFTARRRHLVSIERSLAFLESAANQLAAGQGIEFVAEDLKMSQTSLGEITGEFSSDDLLGTIFSSFCIGK